MPTKDKELYQLRKDALVSSLSRKGLSAFEAKQKALLLAKRAKRANNSDWM
jgi:hypothetical protein